MREKSEERILCRHNFFHPLCLRLWRQGSLHPEDLVQIMKKAGAILLIISLLFGMIPQQVNAANNTFHKELNAYLKEISSVRGFQITKEDIEESLFYNGAAIDDYNNIQELKNDLGEVIQADLSNLSGIYEEYDITPEELKALLKESGEELNDYIFLKDLDSEVYFYLSDKFEREPDFEAKFSDYISSVSAVRGFKVTKEDIYNSLARYETTIDEVETVDELSDFLGEVIKADLSNLNYFKREYNLDKKDIFKLLDVSGEDINDYIFIDDLEATIQDSSYGEFPEFDEDMMEELLPIIFQELDLSDKEMLNIIDYFSSMEDYLSTPEMEQKFMNLTDRFMDLGERLIDLEDSDISNGLPDEFTSEIVSIYNELFSLLKIHVVYSIEKDGISTPISIETLLGLDTLGEGEKLKVGIYDLDGNLLADFVLTNDTIQSILDKLQGVEKEVADTINHHSQKKTIKTKSKHKTTIQGGKLPRTSSGYISYSFAGLFIAFIGAVLLKKIRKPKSEIIQ